jgi:hypothetical protein
MNESSLICPICDGAASITAPLLVLGKYHSFRISCSQCNFEWFSDPFRWLAESYSAPITLTDTGIVDRSLNVYRQIFSFLSIGNFSSRILDWGSGSGLLVRLLRDVGYDCFGYEPFTPPILASAHTFSILPEFRDRPAFGLIIAIEVVEHLPAPTDFFTEVLRLTDTLIFSTELVDSNQHGTDWWYYTCETGQHISFFSGKSLAIIAQKNDCKFLSARSGGLHVITRNSKHMALQSNRCRGLSKETGTPSLHWEPLRGCHAGLTHVYSCARSLWTLIVAPVNHTSIGTKVSLHCLIL